MPVSFQLTRRTTADQKQKSVHKFVYKRSYVNKGTTQPAIAYVTELIRESHVNINTSHLCSILLLYPPYNKMTSSYPCDGNYETRQSIICERDRYTEALHKIILKRDEDCGLNEVFLLDRCIRIVFELLKRCIYSEMPRPVHQVLSYIQVWMDNTSYPLYLYNGVYNSTTVKCTAIFSIDGMLKLIPTECGERQSFLCQTEISTISTETPLYFFQCNDGSYINLRYMCDTENNCLLGEDERLCDFEFQQTKYKKNKKTIPIFCDHSLLRIAQKSHVNQIFESHQSNVICNGEQNCIDGSDEIVCDIYKTSYNQEDCLSDCSSKFCKTLWTRCNEDEPQCFLRSKICTFTRALTGSSLFCPNTEHLHNCKDHICPHMFKCKHSYCIELHNVCDGVQDCPDKEDESGCSQLICIRLLKCKSERTCVHPHKICDNVNDCLISKDDEEFCEGSSHVCSKSCRCVLYHVTCSVVEYDTLIPRMTKVLVIEQLNSLDIFKILNQLYVLYIFNSRLNVLNSDFLFLNSLKFLKVFMLKGDVIFTLRSEMLSKIPNLLYINLQDNIINHFQRNAFSSLHYLKSLNLSHISLTKIDKYAFNGMSVLKHLYLDHNELTHIASNSFNNVSNLTIDLRYNPLTYIVDTGFSHVNIRYISVDLDVLCCYLSEHNICRPTIKQTYLNSPCTNLIKSKICQYIGAFSILSIVFINVRNIRLNYRAVDNTAYQWMTCSFSVTNILASVYICIILFYDVTHRDNFYNLVYIWPQSLACRLPQIIFMFTMLVSNFTISLVALNLLIIIAYPYRKRGLSFYGTLKISLTMWLFCLLLSIFWSNEILLHENSLICSPFGYSSISSNPVAFVALGIVILSTFVTICLHVISLKSAKQTLLNRSLGTSAGKIKFYGLTCRLVLIMLIRVISSIYMIMLNTDVFDRANQDIYTLALFIFIDLNSLYDPIISLILKTNVFSNILKRLSPTKT